MATITRVEALMVDLVPAVKRTDAIQSFVSQETPILRITDADGVVGTGYSYTIGTGGPAIMSLLQHTLAPALIGREASQIERIWRDLLFLTHATSVGAITSLALAAIDTALWDLKCRRANEPLHRMAGGAQSRIPLYTTEGGWLHIDTAELVEDALRAKALGFGGSKIKIGRPHVSEDVARLSAVRDAVGPAFEIMTDANQRFTVDEAIRRARCLTPLDIAWLEEPLSDTTYVATWAGFVYVAFVIDTYARRIVGWRASRTAHAGFVLDALEQAVHYRRPAKGAGLVHHSDRGSQYLSIKYTERLAEAGIEPSVGSVGDSYDNALAETINGLFKAEVIHRRGPWRSFEAERVNDFEAVAFEL